MGRCYDNWEKLVDATLKREQFRQLAREDSLSSTSSSQFSSFSLSETPVSNIYTSLALPLSYEEILQATDDFGDENLIRQGESGDFFIGMFRCFPDFVVVKIINVCNSEHFMTELDFYSRVSGHSRFVPLLGQCSMDEEKFLVYGYMSKGNLSSNLFLKPEEEALQLDWSTRLKIAVGVAEGLAYLHHECDPPMAHGDVQSSSILLDDNFEVRLGSLNHACPQDLYKFSRTITRNIRATTTTKVKPSCADDVFCFGVVLLELVTGKSWTHSSPNDANLWKMILSDLDTMKFVNEIVDQALPLPEDLIDDVRNMATIARSCLNCSSPLRPLIREVLRCLKNSGIPFTADPNIQYQSDMVQGSLASNLDAATSSKRR